MYTIYKQSKTFKKDSYQTT